MVIITYFFLILPGEYTASKSESTPFCLKDTAFSCSRRVFSVTATEGDLQTANFVMMPFTTQKNGARKKI